MKKTFNLGACENETNPCSSNGICLQISPSQFICQCKPEYTGILCQISLFSSDFNTCQCLNGGICLNNGTCSCLNGYIGTRCDMSKWSRYVIVQPEMNAHREWREQWGCLKDRDAIKVSTSGLKNHGPDRLYPRVLESHFFSFGIMSPSYFSMFS